LRVGESLGFERHRAVGVRAAVALQHVVGERDRFARLTRRGQGERERRHRVRVRCRGLGNDRFEQRDGAVGVALLETDEAERDHGIGEADLAGFGIGLDRRRVDVRGPVGQTDLRGRHRGEHRRPEIGSHRRMQRVDLGEDAERFLDAAADDECACEDAERVAVAVPVGHRREQLTRFARGLDGRIGAPRPQPQCSDQHEHHAGGPAVAALARFAEHLFREPFGLGEATLMEPHPGEQPERPTEPAGVADVGERGGGLLQPRVGPISATLAEREPRQVLQGPRLAPAVAHGLVQLERVGERHFGGDVLVHEHQRHAERSQNHRRCLGRRRASGTRRSQTRGSTTKPGDRRPSVRGRLARATRALGCRDLP